MKLETILLSEDERKFLFESSCLLTDYSNEKNQALFCSLIKGSSIWKKLHPSNLWMTSFAKYYVEESREDYKKFTINVKCLFSKPYWDVILFNTFVANLLENQPFIRDDSNSKKTRTKGEVSKD